MMEPCGMFNKYIDNIVSRPQWYQLGQRLAIMTANALMVDKRYRFYIEQIKQLSKLPEEHFDNFYHSFIKRFAEFVQLVPDVPGAPLSSLLINGLSRGFNILHFFVEQFDNTTPLERYALFTACVLRDISHVLTQQKIFITDEQGVLLKLWQPFCGPLTEEVEGDSYKIFSLSSVYTRINQSVRIALARQVMGEHGFLWISNELRLFLEWVEALEEDDEGSGRLVHAIKLYRQVARHTADILPMIEAEVLSSPATQYGDDFYAWLVQGLQDGSIKVNTPDASVHVTEYGVFIESAEIFKSFSEQYLKRAVNNVVVHTQFGNLMGISSKGGQDFLSQQLGYKTTQGDALALGFSLSNTGKTVQGIVVKDPHALFVNGKVPGVSAYVKLPSVRDTAQALSQFNEIMKPNHSMKNR